MDETETKLCENCKREIPAVNFTTHAVHCARNIRVCPVCKEPVPQADLQQHHEILHKLLPCKQCGESVCGTDLEDHIRDSCANTIKSCRYCELELARRELPAHEGYCGVRTEQCAECREWVMIKYRQLHLDSNHGFIRLHDDPPPIQTTAVVKPPKLLPIRSNLPKTSNETKVANPTQRPSVNGYVKNTNNLRQAASSSGEASSSVWRPPSDGLPKPPLKRTNDQPQINTNTAATNKVYKEVVSRGAVKKRPAPKPPSREPPPDPRRDLPYYGALQRYQKEEKERQEQTAYNLSVGLPPVLSPAAKLEKLRKMDALLNPPTSKDDYKNCLQGRVWMNSEQKNNHVVGSSNHSSQNQIRLSQNVTRQNARDNIHSDQNVHSVVRTVQNTDVSDRTVRNESDVDDDVEVARRREEFRNLKPMTSQEFMDRFNELQLRKDDRRETDDRFSNIRTSLRELRRGLNEVTAPYNTSTNASNHVEEWAGGRTSSDSDDEIVRLPCEFCTELVPARDLVQHQTGCRPDLAQFRASPRSPPPRVRPRSPLPRARPTSPRARPTSPRARPTSPRARPTSPRARPTSPRARPPSPRASPPAEPLIPCEFCTRQLPIYLVTEHQERCGRETNLLYAD